MATSIPLSDLTFSRRTLIALAGSTLVAMRHATPFALAADYEPSAFLSADTVHDVSMTIDDDDFTTMIAEYQQSGDKNVIEATVTVDGSTYEQVGVRLKGNSSLRQLLGGGMGGQMGAGTTTSGDVEPVNLPWLIKLDEFVEDQNHDGMEQLVIRSNNSSTSMNEAVALQLLDKAGLASQQAAMVRFAVNESDPILRLAIENPKKKWMKAHFPEDGLLFKSEADGDWSYRGDNYEDYADIAFDLEAGDTGEDAADFAPLIAFLDFVNNADDDAFNAELGDHLDIDQFAVYLAMMDLIQNTDDIDGPGNNSYLYWNRETDLFTVVPWDMNLAFGGFGGGGMGGGGDQFPGGTQQQGTTQQRGTRPGGTTDQSTSNTAPGNVSSSAGTNPQGTPMAGDNQMPQQPDALMGTPADDGQQTTQPTRGQGQMGQGGGMGGRSNPLVERFSANDEWMQLQSSTTDTLRSDLFESGVATTILDTWVELLNNEATDLVDAATIHSEADSISAIIQG